MAKKEIKKTARDLVMWLLTRIFGLFITAGGIYLIAVFYYNELLDVNKLIGFILIWVAEIIYLRDLYINKK